MKKALRTLGIVAAIIVLIAAAYVVYALVAYHRIGDCGIMPEGAAQQSAIGDVEYTVVSYNIGFGAYESDYGFFMDGGDRAWAWSEERLDKNLNDIAGLLDLQDADIYLIQEVDIDSTRSYHVDERKYLTDKLTGKSYTFAQNYDSPFLCYPFWQPHGIARAGIMTFSRFEITSAERVELPVESGLTKYLDLDRCYSKNRIKAPEGRELVVYNFHLSAYTSDGTIATEQLRLLLSDMEEEYKKGNYCIAGGDFNKDVLGDSSVYFGKADREYTWAQPIPKETFDGFHTSLVAPIDTGNPVPSCRNADSAYHEGQYVLTVDGFLVTDNVYVKKAGVTNTVFAFSDHNPVKMTFSLSVSQ
ncbi:MAG: endonuclease/exonuclease/phosphatase family protein [Clostridia bacterium]|nr:endonuclease/exonuclease/phosphatase family protein [Clostridia bacterium]